MKETRYATLSQTQLHALFSSAYWNQLNFDAKIDACQEVENRFALESGVEPCLVKPREMDGSLYGWQRGNVISINSSLLRNGTFDTEYTDALGNTVHSVTLVPAPGWNILDTVYHEGTHGIQEAQGRMPRTYVEYNKDPFLYRIQGPEKEAFFYGQRRTIDAIQDVENALGYHDESSKEYFASVRNDTFQSALEKAMDRYNDPDIENTLSQVIADRDLGVEPFNQSASYQAINTLLNDNKIQVEKNESQADDQKRVTFSEETEHDERTIEDLEGTEDLMNEPLDETTLEDNAEYLASEPQHEEFSEDELSAEELTHGPQHEELFEGENSAEELTNQPQHEEFLEGENSAEELTSEPQNEELSKDENNSESQLNESYAEETSRENDNAEDLVDESYSNITRSSDDSTESESNDVNEENSYSM